MLQPSTRQVPIPIGNETFDKFLGGGFLNSTLNLFERQGPTSRILDSVWNKTFAANTLVNNNCLICLNLDSSSELQEARFFESLAPPRKVRSDVLYKDVRNRSAAARIKIAWRYTNRGLSSPTDGSRKTDQIDFAAGFLSGHEKTSSDKFSLLNTSADDSVDGILSKLIDEINKLKETNPKLPINVIVQDALSPFSAIIDDKNKLFHFMYALRCIARTLANGAILISYDRDMCIEHANIGQQLYNLADSVVYFHSYDSLDAKLTGYKNIDGTLSYLKVPKINTYGFHFQQELSDWGYRTTKNHRFFVVDELSLPPCEDLSSDGKTKLAGPEITSIPNVQKPLEQVGPLEEFREVAKDVLARKLV